MKRNILLLVFICNSFLTKAQDTTAVDTSCKKGGFASFSLNQVGLSNWAGGGENSLSITTLLSGFANYKKGGISWENSLDLGYGLLKSGDDAVHKNEDKIDLNSKYGKLAREKLYYTVLLNFKSQFAPGYNFPNDSTVVSRFAAPAFLTVAVGMDYKPTDYFSVFLSPATGKVTFVNDAAIADAGSFGVEGATYDTAGNKLTNGEKIRMEFGAYLNAKFQKDVTKNVNILSKLTLFNNYTDENAANRKNVDVSWETMINIKAGKYLTTSVFTHLIYDDDIDIPTYETIAGVKTITGKGPKLQFKEVIGIGLSYKF